MKRAIFHLTAKSFMNALKNIIGGGKTIEIPIEITHFNNFSLFTEVEEGFSRIRIVDINDWQDKEGILGVNTGLTSISHFRWENESFWVDRITVAGPEYGVHILPSVIRMDIAPFFNRTRRVFPPYKFMELKRLRVILVGVSRTGMSIFEEFLVFRRGNIHSAQQFTEGKLVLIDPDRFEPHHRDTLLLEREDIGKFKVDVAREKSEQIPDYPQGEIEVFKKSIYDVPLEVFANSDVIITAVDNVSARLYADVISDAFNLVWIDTGVEISEREIGGEIRIFWPHDPRFREVMNIRIEDWVGLLRQRIENSDTERMTLSPVHKEMGKAAFLSLLLNVIEGGREGGRIRISWSRSTVEYKKWNKVRRILNTRGKGLEGINHFRRWVVETFGNGEDILNFH